MRKSQQNAIKMLKASNCERCQIDKMVKKSDAFDKMFS